jgi:hypothetical protein
MGDLEQQGERDRGPLKGEGKKPKPLWVMRAC